MKPPSTNHGYPLIPPAIVGTRSLRVAAFVLTSRCARHLETDRWLGPSAEDGAGSPRHAAPGALGARSSL